MKAKFLCSIILLYFFSFLFHYSSIPQGMCNSIILGNTAHMPAFYYTIMGTLKQSAHFAILEEKKYSRQNNFCGIAYYHNYKDILFYVYWKEEKTIYGPWTYDTIKPRYFTYSKKITLGEDTVKNMEEAWGSSYKVTEDYFYEQVNECETYGEKITIEPKSQSDLAFQIINTHHSYDCEDVLTPDILKKLEIKEYKDENFLTYQDILCDNRFRNKVRFKDKSSIRRIITLANKEMEEIEKLRENP